MDEIKAKCQRLIKNSPISDSQCRASCSTETRDAFDFSMLPPFEVFAYELSNSRIEEKFQRDLQNGDVLYVRIKSVNSGGAMITLVCFAERIRRDLSFLKRNTTYAVPVSALSNRLITGAYYKAVVVDVRSEPIQFQLLQGSALSANDLPAYYRNAFALEKKERFEDYVKKCDGNRSFVKNPFLDVVLNMPKISRASHIPEVTENDLITTCAKMRKEQDKEEAIRIAKEGAKLVKNKEYDAGIKELTEAIKIDENLVDALVTRGAAYYWKSQLKLSVDDLERALTIQPDHANCLPYLKHALVSWAKELLSKNDEQGAVEKFKRVLHHDPKDADALKGLDQINKKKNEVLLVKEVSAEERRLAERKRRIMSEEEDRKKRKKMIENKKKLEEFEKMIEDLKKAPKR